MSNEVHVPVGSPVISAGLQTLLFGILYGFTVGVGGTLLCQWLF